MNDDMFQNNIENINESSTHKYENYLNLLGMQLKRLHKPSEQNADVFWTWLTQTQTLKKKNFH